MLNFNEIKSKRWFAYSVITISAIFYTFGVQAFLTTARILPAGLSAFSNLIAVLQTSASKYVSLIYLVFNIPVVLIMWKKSSKRFIFRTSYFLVSQAIASMFFAIDDVHIYIRNLIVPRGDVLEKIWPIYILSTIGAILTGFAASLAWRSGSSVGGTDIIAHYWVKKTHKSIGKILFILGTSFTIISFSIGISLDESMKKHWASILLSTLTYVLINSFIISILYPRYAKIRIEIHSDKINEINNHFKDNYIHAWQLIEIQSGYTNNKKHIITTYMLLMELNNFKRKVLTIDPKAWISVSKAILIIGQFTDIDN